MTVSLLEPNNKTNKGLVLENEQRFHSNFLENSDVNEMSKIKEWLYFILSKEKETLNTVSHKGYKYSSQSVAHRLLNIPETLSESQ